MGQSQKRMIAYQGVLLGLVGKMFQGNGREVRRRSVEAARRASIALSNADSEQRQAGQGGEEKVGCGE